MKALGEDNQEEIKKITNYIKTIREVTKTKLEEMTA